MRYHCLLQKPRIKISIENNQRMPVDIWYCCCAISGQDGTLETSQQPPAGKSENRPPEFRLSR
ncbi:hypothetical protein SEEM1923_10478 [Salmonella enterica subsp. enterica serovar Miami str. 1923]|nr:hypothetical protein SEEM1923_10478 [Salmonella enterica subsp. enterica serovar Miami str. 1923]